MDKVAQVQQTMDFDPWGARRSTNWAAMSSTELTNTFFKNYSVSNSVGTSSLTSRGFTGHEMLDEVGIIHMNGRIYDAKLGRFLQADPLIQDPFDTQSLNRYSYTNNNPLNAVDPSGFSFLKKWLGTILAIVVTIACVGNCAPAVWAAWAGLAGFVGGFVATGSLKGALIGGLTGAAFGYLGGSFLAGDIGLGQFVAMSALTGGITATLSGGKFGHGFFSAGAGAFIGTKIGGFVKGAGHAAKNIGKFLAKTTLGGALSKVSGGKFANGAGFAAFSAVISYAMTPDSAAPNAPLANVQANLPEPSIPDDLGAVEFASGQETYSTSANQSPPTIEEIRVVGVRDYPVLNTNFADLAFIYNARITARAKWYKVKQMEGRQAGKNLAELKAWQNFANSANGVGAGSAALICGAAVTICKNMISGAVGSTIFDGMSGRSPSPTSVLKGAFIGGFTGPLTSSYISAAGGGYVATAVGRSNEFWTGVAVSEATP